jgi:hypothetical protein
LYNLKFLLSKRCHEENDRNQMCLLSQPLRRLRWGILEHRSWRTGGDIVRPCGRKEGREGREEGRATQMHSHLGKTVWEVLIQLNTGQAPGLTPVIPATQEAEIRRIEV